MITSVGIVLTAGIQLYVSTRIGITTYKAVKGKLMKNKQEDELIEFKEEAL